MAIRKGFMKNWFAVEAIPIYTIVGGVVVGASWYLYRLAMGPTIQWTKSNPTPWNSIKPNQSTKIMTVSHDADKWSRDKL
ncbi:hypothetical protein DFJ43DRAFT_1152187 [Lentinula guzmanii]|uniref:Uncharacterized protein n=2 Tax=Lentinula TaxID=5352 RepID=A0AA38JSA3_9AGAR|nr:hypothetical protein DFJ43DRAFT_1152187 [Lentinula guzmanii]KAJ3802649.1 hypothetical protein GGU11DRAFT_740426 [Lentinula aff. detonsa]KAJ3987573.1 hypothetical protein F5890DRAFT_1551261 [Lentinula detonsa]